MVHYDALRESVTRVFQAQTHRTRHYVNISPKLKDTQGQPYIRMNDNKRQQIAHPTIESTGQECRTAGVSSLSVAIRERQSVVRRLLDIASRPWYALSRHRNRSNDQ